jgi:hypothetical protein
MFDVAIELDMARAHRAEEQMQDVARRSARMIAAAKDAARAKGGSRLPFGWRNGRCESNVRVNRSTCYAPGRLVCSNDRCAKIVCGRHNTKDGFRICSCESVWRTEEQSLALIAAATRGAA